MSLATFHHRFAHFAAVVSLAAGLAGVPESRAERAGSNINFVVIMTDDLSLGLFDHLLASDRLPHISERLVTSGIRFSNAFVTTPTCCPSRATFLRGQYAHNHGVLSNLTTDPFVAGIGWPGWLADANGPGTESDTLAVWLQQAGYVTGHIGKYLNGYGRVAPPGVAPETYIPPGWTDWQGLIDPSTYQVFDYQMNDNGTLVEYGNATGDYQTDTITTRAVSFIDEHAGQGAPFLLVLNPAIPHVEIVPIEAVVSTDYRDGFHASIRPPPRYEYLIDGDLTNDEIAGLPTKPSFNEADLSDKPLCEELIVEPGVTYNKVPLCTGNLPLLRGPQTEEDDIAAVNSQYQAMGVAMLAIDDLVGEIFAVLDRQGATGNTVVVFTSDNGYLYGEHRAAAKDLPYEEAIRVPLLVSGPGFPPGVAQQVILNNDLAPTIAAIAGVQPPYETDGRSFVPVLVDLSRTDWHRRSFLVEYWFLPSLLKFGTPTFDALRSPDPSRDLLYTMWRADPLASTQITHDELYLLSVDPWQQNNLTQFLPQSSRAALQQIIQLLRGCSGMMCTAAERL